MAGRPSSHDSTSWANDTRTTWISKRVSTNMAGEDTDTVAMLSDMIEQFESSPLLPTDCPVVNGAYTLLEQLEELHNQMCLSQPDDLSDVIMETRAILNELLQEVQGDDNLERIQRVKDLIGKMDIITLQPTTGNYRIILPSPSSKYSSTIFATETPLIEVVNTMLVLSNGVPQRLILGRCILSSAEHFVQLVMAQKI